MTRTRFLAAVMAALVGSGIGGGPAWTGPTGVGSGPSGAPRSPPLLPDETQEWRAVPEPLHDVTDVPVSLASEDSVFAWPPPPPEWPGMEDVLTESTVSLEAARAWQLRSKRDLAAEMGDALFSGPEILLDHLLTAIQALSPRPHLQTLPRSGEEGIYGGILEFHSEPRAQGSFQAFLHEWASREQRYFSRFEDSRVTTVGFESGMEDVDLDTFESDQEKLLWDALRNAYLSKYRFRPEERVREGAFSFGRWRGMDFVLLPPVIGGFLWVRGLERRISLGGTSLRISIEPLSRWARDDDLETGAAFEWSPSKDFLLSVIVLTGLEDGNAEIEFVGIGTSFGMARKMIVLQRDE